MEFEISEDSQILERQLATLSTYFKYPQEVRTLIYTTNIIEGFNRQPMIDITKKWTGRRKDWGIIHSQLDICFPGRMS